MCFFNLLSTILQHEFGHWDVAYYIPFADFVEDVFIHHYSWADLCLAALAFNDARNLS